MTPLRRARATIPGPLLLQLYILRQLAVGFLFAVGGMAFVAIPGVAVSAVHKLGGSGMSVLLGYLPLVLVELVPYLLPIGFLLAIVAAYGRLAADNEWTAIQMAGFSPLRMLVPGFALAGVLALATLYLACQVSPGLRLAKRAYIKDSAVQAVTNLSPGRTEIQYGDFFLKARWRDERTFHDVFIHVPPDREEDEPETIMAARVSFRFQGDEMRLLLEDARRVHAARETSVGRLVLTRSLDALFKTRDTRRTSWKYQPTDVLRRQLEEGSIPAGDVHEARYEIHRRYTLAATFFLFLLLGAPTGLLLRRGTQLAALSAATGYAFAYYLLSMRLGKVLAGAGTLPEPLAAWATTILGGMVGLCLTWRVLHR